LLYLGRLEVDKGANLLCAAFAEHAVRFPGLRLDVAGWGTQEMVLRQRYGAHPQIAFHGAVFGEDKARLLAGCDAMVVPSVGPEVFGNVVAEAYAYGKPVLATCAGGLPELVSEGEMGWLIPAGDAGALGDALERLAQNAAGARRMSTACFQAAQRFAVESVVAAYVSLYDSVNP
jgi:glycosyltransferase involved in cell wall biosynthesis